MKPYQLSDSQFNLYIVDASNKLYTQRMAGRAVLTGDDILQFAPHNQVNKFILFQVFQDWNGFMARLQHPYFDHTQEDVKQALQIYQNALSQHIRITAEDFKPLIEKAVFNTIKLILNPHETFSNFFFLNKDVVTLQLFQKYASFFDDFDFVVNGVLGIQRKANAPSVSREQFFELMEKIITIFEQKQGMSIDDYRRSRFQNLTGVDLEVIAISRQPKEPPQYAASTPPPRVEPQPEPRTRANRETEVVPPRRAEPTPPPAYSAPAPAPSADYQPKPASPTPIQPPKKHHEPLPPASDLPNPGAELPRVGGKVVVPKPPVVNAPDPFTSRADALKPAADPPQRVMDRFAANSGASVNSAMAAGASAQGGKAISIAQIPLHKQFQYVQRVFAGSKAKFQDTVDAINGMSSVDEANKYLNTRILNMPEVQREDPVVQEFVQIVQNRF